MPPVKLGEGRVEYSTVRANNQKYALLQQLDGSINLHEIYGTFIRKLPPTLRTDTNTVFSHTSQDHVYCIEGDSVYRHYLLDDTRTLVMAFPQYASLSSSHVEGDLTPSGWLSLCGVLPDGVESVFAFNVVTLESSDHRPQSEPFDGLKVADDGTLILSKSSGIWALPRVGMARRLTNVNGHACVCPLGLAWCSAADPAINMNAICLIDIATAKLRTLKVLEWDYAVHITAHPTGLYVSAFDPTGKRLFQIWDVPFNALMLPVLLHEWKSVYRGYDSAPKATYSAGRVLYNVDDGSDISVWGFEVKSTLPPPAVETPKDYELVSMVNEPDADYMMVLPIRDGKALPWKMFKKTL